MKTRRITRLALAALLAAGIAVPALAAGTPIRADRVRDDINALDNAIDRADNRDTISEREAANLRRRVHGLRNQFQQMNRNGLSHGEVNALETRINTIRTRLRMDRVDWDHHPG
jgi:hypothetical protein